MPLQPQKISRVMARAAEEQQVWRAPYFYKQDTNLIPYAFLSQVKKKNCTECKKKYRNKREKDFLTPKPWLTTQGAIRDKRQTANVPRMKFSFRRVFAIALKDWSWEISWRFYVRNIAWIISFSDAAMSFHLLVWSIIASCKAEWL